jgi:hypothetical protein
MMKDQVIIVVWSIRPCFVQGWPALDYVGLGATYSHEDLGASVDRPQKVAVLPVPIASFAVTTSGQPPGDAQTCAVTSTLRMGAPDGIPTAVVALSTETGATGWATCGGPAWSTPFQQGITSDRYLYS